MSAGLLTPGSGGGKPKPVTYNPLSSIQAPKTKPEPQEPTVPIVVFTAFDADTAEKLKARLEETIHPVDQPRRKETYDPLSSIRAPAQSSQPSLPDIAPDVEEESETIFFNAERARSHEDLFLSMDAVDLSYYSSTREYELVREVATCLRHEKLIHFFLDDPRECLKLFPSYTWDEEAAGAAEEFIQWYVNRFRTELERQRDIDMSGPAFGEVEDTIKDLTNDERESVIAIDLDTGETLFVRYGDKDSVTLQELHQKLADGRNIVVIHNHPNNTGASLADLSAAAWLDAEYLLVVNPDGTLHRHRRIGDRLVELEPVHNPHYVAAVDPLETALASIAYLIQSLRESGNPPEMVMRQESNEDEIAITMDSRLVNEFLLNPATLVFLDDLADEYEVEDSSFYGAIVSTIIYRELRKSPSLEVAGIPVLQRFYEGLEAVANLPSYGLLELGRLPNARLPTVPILDGDPSAGIGGLSSKAVKRIERDAEKLGMSLYIPDIGFDIPRRLHEYSYERGKQSASLREPFSDPLLPEYYNATILPPSNNSGVWRSVMPENADRRLRGWRERHEPTLGYIAAEVAIAMQTTEYQKLQTEEERMAYLIAYHAYRSVNPPEDLYNPKKFSDTTREEIRWAEDYEALMDAVRTKIQSVPQDR